MLNTIKENYLLIPSVPTPNGRLHLGHIGGPYLSVDILRRYLESLGHHAIIISGTDSYESYMTAQAEKEQSTPEKIGRHYHSLIAEDLIALDIELECFVNPLDEVWENHYQTWQYETFKQLQNNNLIHELDEYVPWDESKKRYLTGCWLQGDCPSCHLPVRGYFCENCGAHFRPEEAVKEQDVIRKKMTNFFLKLTNQANLDEKGINNHLKNSYFHFIAQQNGLLRLTANSDYGLKFGFDTTLFNYGLMFAYFLMFGEIAGKIFGIEKNTFSLDSTVTTIASFGIDNFIPFLGSTLGISEGSKLYKPFDYYLINHFYHLDGQKFSTSRGHAIWVKDSIKNHSSDVIRLYLASINVRHQIGNFIHLEFMQFCNDTQEWMNQLIENGFNKLDLSSPKYCDDNFFDEINRLFHQQAIAFRPQQFHPHDCVHLIHHWLERGNLLDITSPQYFWWLKTLSLLIYPIMPQFGKKIWNHLGYKHNPVFNDFTNLPDERRRVS